MLRLQNHPEAQIPGNLGHWEQAVYVSPRSAGPQTERQVSFSSSPRSQPSLRSCFTDQRHSLILLDQEVAPRTLRTTAQTEARVQFPFRKMSSDGPSSASETFSSFPDPRLRARVDHLLGRCTWEPHEEQAGNVGPQGLQRRDSGPYCR